MQPLALSFNCSLLYFGIYSYCFLCFCFFKVCHEFITTLNATSKVRAINDAAQNLEPFRGSRKEYNKIGSKSVFLEREY